MMVRLLGLAVILGALAGFAPVPYRSKILFAGGTDVPRPVQEFAWRVIETHCNYQRYELEERSFWAYDTHATELDGTVAYSTRSSRSCRGRRASPRRLSR